jgi:hypothetical protein
MKFGNEFWLILSREYISPNLFAVLCEVYVLKTLCFGTFTLYAATFCNIMSCDVFTASLKKNKDFLKSASGLNFAIFRPIRGLDGPAL